MKIIEKFIKGKKEDFSLCEDRLFESANFIAVIDGVTTKNQRSFCGKAGGRAAAEKICEAISTFSPEISISQAVKTLTESVSMLYNSDESFGAAAAAVIIFSAYKKEIWCIGDCQCIINSEKHLHEKEIDAVTSNMRAAALQMYVNEGYTEQQLTENDLGRSFILPILNKQHLFANRNCKFGYPIINGSDVPESMFVTHKVKEGDTVVLASDGYPVLCETLEESEIKLKEVLKNDPLCYKEYMSTKGLAKDALSFDDRTYIKFIV